MTSHRLLLGLALALAACAQPAGPGPQPGPDAAGGGISGTVSLGAGVASVDMTRASPASGAVRPQSTRVARPDWSLPHVSGQVLVVGESLDVARVQSLGGLNVRRALAGASLVDVPAGENERDFAERLARSTGRVVQPNYIYRPQATPNDPLYATGQAGYLSQINMPAAWDVETRGARVAVIDTGADFSHPDLAGRLVRGRDFCSSLVNGACVGEDADPSDAPSNINTNAGHGTHVAGIIGATTNNGTGVAGITWAGEILVVKALDYDALGAGATTVSLAKSIQYASDPAQGAARVINISLGLPTYDRNADPTLGRAIQDADARDVLMVAASGNYAAGTPDANLKIFYPASDPLVLAVGAVDPVNFKSGRGPELDLVAPGEGILSTKSGGGYEERTGTSQAAPMVAGVAALIRGRNPGLSSLDVRSILLRSAKDLGAAGRDDIYGAGLLDAGKALAQARPAAGTGGSKVVEVFADRVVNASDPKSDDVSNSGYAKVTLAAGASSVAFKITTTINGTALPAGEYRVRAYVDENTTNALGFSGDLFARSGPLTYTGAALTGVNLTLNRVP